MDTSNTRPPRSTATAQTPTEASWSEMQLAAPLALLQESCARLARTPLTGEQKQLTEQMKRAIQALTENLSELLPESPEARELDAFELRPVIESVLERLAERAWQNQLELAYSLQNDVVNHIPGNPQLLESVMEVLTSLAIKICRQGEVVVWVSREEPTSDETQLRFSFRCNARKLDSALLEGAVLPLLTSGQVLPRRYDDVSLELFPLTRRIHKLGGTLELNGVQSNGFTLQASIPWQMFDLPVQPTELRLFEPGASRALLVGRDTMNNALLRMTLGEWGLRIDVAGDLTAALQLLRQSSLRRFPYTLLILDGELEPSPTAAILASLLPTDSNSALPVMLLKHLRTGVPMELEVYARKHPGLVHVVSRPTSYQKLLQVMQGIARPTLEPELARLQARAQAESRDDESATPDAPPAHILVIDDNEINRRVVVRMLQKLNYQATSVGDGMSALRLLKRESFDAVLIDYHMPEIEGPEIAETVRSWEQEDTHVPLIAMTASAFDKERKRCQEAGIDRVLTKPIKLQELRDVLRFFLQPQTRPRIDFLPLASADDPPIDPAAVSTLTSHLQDDAGGTDSELLPLFLDQLSNHHRALLEAYGMQDRTSIGRVAHALKSVCVYLGAHRLAQICDSLQQDPERITLADAGTALAQLAHELDRVRSALHMTIKST